MPKSIFLENEEATIKFATELAIHATPPLIIFLSGDLGAGKTTFVRGFLQGFGHLKSVKSPTYTLVEEYVYQGVTLYHFDLYRIAHSEELEYIGIREYFREDAILLIEWPERGMNILPMADLVLSLSIKDSGRLLNMKAQTEKGKIYY